MSQGKNQFQSMALSGQLAGNEGAQIETIMQQLKQKVLDGQTLNHFKKEIAQISVLLDKSDNQQIFEKTVFWLSNILQKGEKEVSLMIKRHSLQEQKKKKKTDIDRRKQTLSTFVERDLKEMNCKRITQELDGESKEVIISLDQIDPANLLFVPSRDLMGMFVELKNVIEEFVNANNEYIQIKIQEEKVKVSAADANRCSEQEAEAQPRRRGQREGGRFGHSAIRRVEVGRDHLLSRTGKDAPNAGGNPAGQYQGRGA